MRIRQFTPDDAAIVLLLSNEESSRIGLPSQVYRDLDHARSEVEYLVSQYAAPGHPKRGPYVLAVEHRESSTLIGHVGLSPLDDDVEIGFSIAESYQRRGLATEAINEVSRWAFETFGLDRILAITSATNLASKRTLVRSRFIYAGEETMRFQGRNETVSIYALPGRSTTE